MTDDELLDQIRAEAAPGDQPAPGSAEAVAEVEAAVGHPMPALLKRIYLEVADGGFGRWGEALSLTDTTYQFSDSPRLVEAYLTGWRDKPGHPASVVPLLEWGCAIWSFVDFSTSDGRMWAWDPNQRCLEHALFPEGVTLAERLAGWLDGRDEAFPEPPAVSDCPACSVSSADSGLQRLN
ncbi:hypothetical protein ACIOKD_35340 [Streptomyces sp. NPDC087844]|uniref:hypothetical protein n=1 Tax=Streptomyces sp. NPDC087844 TaxID=3365805 RepID=UPI00381CE0C6